MKVISDFLSLSFELMYVLANKMIDIPIPAGPIGPSKFIKINSHKQRSAEKWNILSPGHGRLQLSTGCWLAERSGAGLPAWPTIDFTRLFVCLFLKNLESHWCHRVHPHLNIIYFKNNQWLLELQCDTWFTLRSKFCSYYENYAEIMKIMLQHWEGNSVGKCVPPNEDWL